MDPEQNLGKIQIIICLHAQATCDQKINLKPCQQVIQLTASALLLGNQGISQIDNFHMFCKPKCNPKLTEFCKDITGLNDLMLKDQKNIQIVIQEFQKWVLGLKGIKNNNYTFVTWGSWTLSKGLLLQLRIKKIKIPQIFHSYSDFKRTCGYIFKKQQPNLHKLSKQLNIPLSQQPQTKSQQTLQLFQKCIQKAHNLKKYQINRKSLTILHDIPNINVTPQLQYLLVLDFQATCQQDIKLKPCSQIIEFPVMVVSLKEGKIIDQFHHYVMPKFNTKLTKFCTELTGITQDMVDGKLRLEEVLEELDQWIFSKEYLQAKNFTFVTCGDWDLCSCLKNEAKCKNIQIPDYLKNYINIKNVFQLCMPQFDGSMGMMGMLRGLDIPHEGRHHSGIDDVRNICHVCLGLMKKKGFKFTKQNIKYVK